MVKPRAFDAESTKPRYFHLYKGRSYEVSKATFDRELKQDLERGYYQRRLTEYE